ncbi:MAG TPA: oligosaccharide flippase family protein [Thermoleophilia bacterium]|nr:oligosaccharide flippase family protein [Thermoleophilia bacterium]
MARPIGAEASEASRAWSRKALGGYLSLPLFRNAAYLWLNTIILSGLGFVFWAAAARLYTADAVGYGASAIAAINLIGSFSHLGLGFGIIRFLPERRESSAGLVNSVFLVTGATSLLASSVFLLGLDLWAPDLDLVRNHPVFLITFVAGGTAFSLSQVLDQVFVATRRAGFVLIKNLGVGMLRVALIVSLAAFFASFGIVAAHAVAGGLLVGVSLVALLPAALKGYKAALEWKPREIRSMSSFAAGNYLGALLLLAPGNLFTIMVLNAAGPKDAAYFYVAWTIGMAASALALALATSLFAEGSHDPRQLRQHAMKAMLGGTVPSILVALTVILGAGLILRAFGSDYASSSATLLRLLALASLPYFLVNVYLGVARVEKNITAIVLVAGTMAAVSLAAGYPLVHSMGLQGIGIAWIAGQLSALAIAVAFFAKGHLLVPDDRHQSSKSFNSIVEDTTGGGT